MYNLLVLSKKILKQVKDIIFPLVDNQTKVFIFGSRANNKARKFSDIDIGLEADNQINFETIGQIKQAFEESDLPYNVDIVEFSKLPKKFKKVAQKNIIYLN